MTNDIDDGYREVRFDTYCPKCKYRDFPEEGEPCAECLSVPMVVHSYKPEKYVENDGTFSKYSKPKLSEADKKYLRAIDNVFDISEE